MSRLETPIRKNDNVLVIAGSGIMEREAALHASNVQLVCPECGVQTRIGHKILGDGRKVRVCRKCEGVVDK